MKPLDAWPPKRAAAHLDHALDFRPYLMDGETVLEWAADVSHGSIEITSKDHLEGYIVLWIKGGKPNELCKVLGTVKTTAGRTYALEPILPIL